MVVGESRASRRVTEPLDVLPLSWRRHVEHTHWGARSRFSHVCPKRVSPSMNRSPSAQKLDMAARLVVPSGLRLLMTATGVPK